MLKVRREQLQSMGDARSSAFNAQVSDLLCERCAEGAATPSVEYVRAIVELSAKTCRDEGFSQPGTVFEFAQSMLKDNEQPLSEAQMTAKAHVIVRELRARALFEQLQAVAGSQARSGTGNATLAGTPQE